MKHYKKLKWKDIVLGQIAYFEMMVDGKLVYKQVKIYDIKDNKVYYEHDYIWKEYQTKSEYEKIGLFIEDKQIYLNL